MSNDIVHTNLRKAIELVHGAAISSNFSTEYESLVITLGFDHHGNADNNVLEIAHDPNGELYEDDQRAATHVPLTVFNNSYEVQSQHFLSHATPDFTAAMNFVAEHQAVLKYTHISYAVVFKDFSSRCYKSWLLSNPQIDFTNDPPYEDTGEDGE